MHAIIDIPALKFEPEMVENLVDRELHVAVIDGNFSQRAFGKFRGVSVIEDEFVRTVILYWGTGSQIRCGEAARIMFGETEGAHRNRIQLAEIIEEMKDESDAFDKQVPWYNRPFNTWFGGGDA